jgi:hypothetical protein
VAQLLQLQLPPVEPAAAMQATPHHAIPAQEPRYVL